MTHILAIDQGTTSSRAIVFDKEGRIVSTAQKELPQHFPNDGWVEHDAMDIWRDTLETCRKALSSAKLSGKDVAAIGITNQRETAVLWDRATGEPVHHAIVWQDRRGAGFCRELAAGNHEALIRDRTGLLIDPYFSSTKLTWLLENAGPDIRKRAEAGDLAFGTVDSWLIYKLTGGAAHVTDATNASRTQLFDIKRNRWDEDLLALFKVPAAILPEVLDCAARFGETEPDLFGHPIPITGVAGDQQAALIGQTCFEPGMVKSTYGTGAFALMNIGETPLISRNRLLTTIGYRLEGRTTYALEGSIFVAGATVQWLRDGLRLIGSASETEALARSVSDTGGCYMVPAFTGLGAPHWDPDARGAIVGLTRDTSLEQVVRAALEAQGYQTRDLIDAMSADSRTHLLSLRVDGGMVANDWICQFLADVTAVEVERPEVIETTALGAAYLAGLTVGVFEDLKDLSRRWRREHLFQPRLDAGERERLLAGWARAVKRVSSDIH